MEDLFIIFISIFMVLKSFFSGAFGGVVMKGLGVYIS